MRTAGILILVHIHPKPLLLNFDFRSWRWYLQASNGKGVPKNENCMCFYAIYTVYVVLCLYAACVEFLGANISQVSHKLSHPKPLLLNFDFRSWRWHLQASNGKGVPKNENCMCFYAIYTNYVALCLYAACVEFLGANISQVKPITNSAIPNRSCSTLTFAAEGGTCRHQMARCAEEQKLNAFLRYIH